MRLPFTDQPNSSAAIRAASSDPRPEAVDKGPFMSTRTPILIVLSAACDGGLKNTLAVNASTPRRRHAIGICGKISSQSDCLLFAREAHSHMPTQPTRART
jgi:hypothetical protein